MLHAFIQQLKSRKNKKSHNEEKDKNKIYSEPRDYPDKTNKLFHFADIDKRMRDDIALKEASSLDGINMTKFWLDYDQKIFAPTDLSIRTLPKDYTDDL